jgi:hypothetical protein
MVSKWLRLGIGLALIGVVLPWPSRASAGPVVFSAAGANPAAIQGTVDSFRAALGNPDNGNAAGPIAGGRREINWDGGGSTATTAPVTPFTTFTVTRGATFTTPGTGLSQAPPTGGAQGGLTTLFNNATYGTIFVPFSNPRLFVPVGSNITVGTFTLPGNPNVQATVSAFGAVFEDVDLANTTTISFFALNGSSLGTFNVPPADGGLSFLGVQFNAGERIARVQITTGNSALGPNDGGGIDVVAMDDFIFAEPQAVVPEPSSLTLGVIVAVALGLVSRRRKRARAQQPAKPA